MKLLDSYRSPAYLPEDHQFHQWWQQTYGKPETECLLPLFQSYVENGYQGNGVVFGVILARMMLFSEAVFKFRRQSDKKLFGTPDLLPLENPWPNGNTGELLAHMIQDVDLAGNAFIRSDPDRLVRLRPDWVDIVRVGTGQDTERTRWEVAGYMYWLSGRSGQAEFYPVEEVAHWSPIPDPLADFRGMSWLTPVVKEINADIAMTEYKRKFMDNSATPNLLVKYQQQLTDSALARVRAVWDARYGGTDGMKTAILDSGADVVPIGNSMQAMTFTDVQAAGENRIAVAGGVPGIVVGLKEGLQAATYSNYEQAMRRFADVTMRPLWRSVCAALAPLVTAQDGAELWYDVSDIAALRQGEKDRAETTTLQAQGIAELVRYGFDPMSAVSAFQSGDVSQLTHNGVAVDITSAVPKAAPAPAVLADPNQSGEAPA